MTSEREIIESVMQRLRTALERGTGTSLDADEVKTVGRMLYAISAGLVGGHTARRACAVCGGPDHQDEEISANFVRHPYEPAVLVPLPE